MSKTPVDFTFQEGLTSAEHNQQTVDYLTSGENIIDVVGGPYTSADNTANAVIIGWHPYNPAESIWDRFRILGESCVPPGVPQYTVDSGASWVNIIGGVPPISTATPCNPFGNPFDLTLDLSALIVSFQWIGLRLPSISLGGISRGYIFVQGFLYNNTFNPF